MCLKLFNSPSKIFSSKKSLIFISSSISFVQSLVPSPSPSTATTNESEYVLMWPISRRCTLLILDTSCWVFPLSILGFLSLAITGSMFFVMSSTISCLLFLRSLTILALLVQSWSLCVVLMQISHVCLSQVLQNVSSSSPSWSSHVGMAPWAGYLVAISHLESTEYDLTVFKKFGVKTQMFGVISRWIVIWILLWLIRDKSTKSHKK